MDERISALFLLGSWRRTSVTASDNVVVPRLEKYYNYFVRLKVYGGIAYVEAAGVVDAYR